MATICTATTRRLPQKGNDLRVRARRIWGGVSSTGSSGARRLASTQPRDGIGWCAAGEAEKWVRTGMEAPGMWRAKGGACYDLKSTARVGVRVDRLPFSALLPALYHLSMLPARSSSSPPALLQLPQPPLSSAAPVHSPPAATTCACTVHLAFALLLSSI